jgi:hypothetical protein
MTIEKIPHNGMIVISHIIGDGYYTQKYVGYTLKEARQLFREYLKEEVK